MKKTFFLSMMLGFHISLLAQPDGSVAEILKEAVLFECPYGSEEMYYLHSDKEGNMIALGVFFVKEDNGYNRRAIKFNKEGEIVAYTKRNELDIPYRAAIQENGQILFITNEYVNRTHYGRIMRINADLSIDNNFNYPEELINDIYFSINGAGAIAFDKKNRIYIGGATGNGVKSEHGSKLIYRLNLDGSLDEDFFYTIPDFYQVNYEITGILVQKDGKILVAGRSTSSDISIIRLNEDGSRDESYYVPLESGHAFTMKEDNENRVIIAGTFNMCNGKTANKIARLLPDGTTDSEFNTGTGFGTHYSYRVKDFDMYDNGKIIVSGNVYQYNGKSISQMVALNEDGSIWQDFKRNAVFNDVKSIYTTCKINNNELGAFALYNDSKYRIARIGERILTSNIEIQNNQALSVSLHDNTLELTSEQSGEYYILSVDGKIWAQGRLENFKKSIPVGKWPQAMYLVHFKSSKGICTQKILKE